MLLKRVRLLVVVLIVLWVSLKSALATQLYLLLRLPFVWASSSADSIISLDRDQFDVTFEAYSTNDWAPLTWSSQFEPRIPATLHHIHLGGSQLRPEWQKARAECLKHHPDWKHYLWDEAAATRLVHEEFPEIADLWESYPYLVQRVDALRYMVLYKYGGMSLLRARKETPLGKGN